MSSYMARTSLALARYTPVISVFPPPLPPSLPPCLPPPSEENSSIAGVGVEKLLEQGKLDKLKNGPLFWVDSADSHPCMGQRRLSLPFSNLPILQSNYPPSWPLHWFIPLSPPHPGTATAMMWRLRAEGRLFHSGLPHKGINSMELGMEAMAYIQKNFYKDFPAVRQL